MENRPVSETSRELKFQSGNKILSIQLRLDGLSFASMDAGVKEVPFGKGPARVMLENALSAAGLAGDIPAVSVCVPTDQAVLVPAGADRPDIYDGYWSAHGHTVTPDTRIFAQPCGTDMVLLYAVCGEVIQPLREKFGDSVSFFHPLYVSLSQPVEPGTILRIDRAGGYAAFTLSAGKELLFADVFPVENEEFLLLAVNRIAVTNKVGAFRAVCSGDACDETATLLQRHYRDVSVHPDGVNRNLLFPLR